MSKHRRTTHHRKIAIAAVAMAAVGVPSVAMACMNPEGTGNRGSYQWENARSEQAWHGNESELWWDGNKWDRKPSAQESQTPTATPGTPKPAASKPAAPKPTATKTAAPKPAAPKPVASKPAAPKPTTTKPAAPESAAPSTAAPASGDVARVVELVNSERSKAGCSPVTLNAKLSKAAQDHSEDMAAHQNMSHTGSDGSDAGDRITRAGYSWSTYGENVAYGYETPESVMAGWMSSPGHRENILNCAFKEIGVGLAQPGDYWTQDFGTAR
ncbi:CAP domain-containing protein [Streptomyces sp. PKU-EA00015]|uniref:CAP domain-containing protein n=1 Tax=Streptomyces sp. PKU-EA00015 TaxID=2748326 RepID=UPI0015A153DD|nr:CAP domain-containing protein [Streptomyces sp. PKU-EA00015]NWF27331.1 CAP domain-containing protein [Streptomyces sp. PKU-EA00015]